MTLLVELVVPDRELWSGEARTVIAKTVEGDIGVLTGHSPVFGVLAERQPGRDPQRQCRPGARRGQRRLPVRGRRPGIDPGRAGSPRPGSLDREEAQRELDAGRCSETDSRVRRSPSEAQIREGAPAGRRRPRPKVSVGGALALDAAWLFAAFLVILTLAAVGIAARRFLLERGGGTVECGLRRSPNGSWRLGVASYRLRGTVVVRRPRP